MKAFLVKTKSVFHSLDEAIEARLDDDSIKQFVNMEHQTVSGRPFCDTLSATDLRKIMDEKKKQKSKEIKNKIQNGLPGDSHEGVYVINVRDTPKRSEVGKIVISNKERKDIRDFADVTAENLLNEFPNIDYTDLETMFMDSFRYYYSTYMAKGF